MKDVIVNWATYHLVHNREGERFSKPSKTVPGMAESLHSLLRRLVRGENVTVYEGVYTGEDEVVPDNLERMDFAQRLDLADELRGSIAAHQAGRRRQAVVPPGPAPRAETDKPPKEGSEGGTTE